MQSSTAGLHGWTNFYLDHGENLVSQRVFRVDTSTVLTLAKLGFWHVHGRPQTEVTDEDVIQSDAGARSWYNFWLGNDDYFEPDTWCKLDHCLGFTPGTYDGILPVSGSSHVPECCKQSAGVLHSSDTSQEFPDVQRDSDRPGSEDLCDLTNLDYNLTTPDQPSQIAVDDHHLRDSGQGGCVQWACE